MTTTRTWQTYLCTTEYPSVFYADLYITKECNLQLWLRIQVVTFDLTPRIVGCFSWKYYFSLWNCLLNWKWFTCENVSLFFYRHQRETSSVCRRPVLLVLFHQAGTESSFARRCEQFVQHQTVFWFSLIPTSRKESLHCPLRPPTNTSAMFLKELYQAE